MIQSTNKSIWTFEFPVLNKIGNNLLIMIKMILIIIIFLLLWLQLGPVEDHYGLTQFRINRNNRLLRIYENSWLWKDINIGSHGYYTFNVPVPQTPAKWLVTAFGISNSQGFGLHQKTIEYSSTRPFFMNVEMPSLCTIGEQIGIRVSIFNYMESPIEVLVILGKSKDYKFVHVEAFGFVSSYAPRISSGEHQHLVFVRILFLLIDLSWNWNFNFLSSSWFRFDLKKLPQFTFQLFLND